MFDPVRVQVRDPLSGVRRTLTVIGVLSNRVPQDMPGIWTPDETAAALFGSRAAPTIRHLRQGVDPDTTAAALERNFPANGVEATTASKRLQATSSRRRRGMSEPATATIPVVIADDHAVVRSALRLLLEAEDDLEVCGEAGDVPGAIRLVERLRPSVLVLDLSMPGGSTLEAIRRLRASTPETAIVVLTMRDDPSYARRALSDGALAFVLKEAADKELLEAVRLAARRETYLSPRMGARVAALPPEPAVPHDGLTDRELEVLRRIALGHTNSAIAEQLQLSVRTVETHRAHVQRKLGRSRRAELVGYALDHKLIET